MVGKPTPCAPCDFKPPQPNEEAEEFLEFWGFCNSQWRIGMNGPIGLDYTACKVVSDALDYPWNDVTLTRLRLLEQKVIEQHSNTDND